MRRILLTLLLAAWLGPAVAATPSDKSIETLLQLTKVESMMESLYAGMEQVMQQGMKQAAAGRQLTPAQQRSLDQLPAKFVEAMRQELTWSTLKPQYVQIYKETFTQTEVNDLIRFYRTPSGRSLIDKMPVVMQKSMAVAQGQLQTFIPRVRKAIDDTLREAEVQQ